MEAERASSFLSEASQYYDRHRRYLAIPARPLPHTGKSRSNNLSLRDTTPVILLAFFAFLLFLCGLGVRHWPTNPVVKIMDIELNHANVSKSGSPPPAVSMDLEIQVRNRDFVDREYDSILLLLQYEGKWEGNTTTDGVAVAARSTSSLQLHAQFHLSDRPDDVAGGFVSVGIAVHIGGNFPFLTFNVVVHGTTSCTITVDGEQQALTCQECCTKNS